jgi:hypothetical protein
MIEDIPIRPGTGIDNSGRGVVEGFLEVLFGDMSADLLQIFVGGVGHGVYIVFPDRNRTKFNARLLFFNLKLKT